MLLAIDAGNTNTVFAVYDGEERKGLWRAATDTRRTADEHFVWLSQVMAVEGVERSDIDSAIISIRFLTFSFLANIFTRTQLSNMLDTYYPSSLTTVLILLDIPHTN